LKIGDLVKPQEDLPLAYDWYHEGISLGVVVSIINPDILPNLVEVMWNDGTSTKVYSDDIEKLQKNEKPKNN